ncbi:uncharacterized protein LOC113557677 [Rhopalosiphum maidis]|uniref:uncharacterized protein LOC113557677 n=1 Tax=Rhopalosiphum maidis TaxID=43146 RepID=UPI000F009835|nr:uncharacterized protein LOC113557677 [Rhopalosiphum maidis]
MRHISCLSLDKLDAESVTTKILSFMEDSGLNLSIYGQGYDDGCATMAGKVGGVAKLIQPVTNILQGVSMELYKVREHVEELLKMLEDNRTNANEIFDLLFTDAKSIEDDFEFTITCPRITGKQSHKNNYSYESPKDYYRVSIFLPYLDSIIQCIKERFEKTESEGWYSLWQKKDCRSMDIIDLLEHSNIFFPSITIALEIFLSLPATSCTAERSFSTLRRVKTWLRSTTGEERLNGLCMLSVHRERINIRKEKFIEQLITRFAIEQPRRLQFLFNIE